jgi:hypothetical protein
MRTTIRIDDDAIELAQQVARARRIPLGKAVSALIRKGSLAQTPVRHELGLTIFDLPEDSPVVTMEMVRQLENE